VRLWTKPKPKKREPYRSNLTGGDPALDWPLVLLLNCGCFQLHAYKRLGVPGKHSYRHCGVHGHARIVGRYGLCRTVLGP
jgi:hypothetical protein